jgi:hypothetical protein
VQVLTSTLYRAAAAAASLSTASSLPSEMLVPKFGLGKHLDGYQRPYSQQGCPGYAPRRRSSSTRGVSSWRETRGIARYCRQGIGELFRTALFDQVVYP